MHSRGRTSSEYRYNTNYLIFIVCFSFTNTTICRVHCNEEKKIILIACLFVMHLVEDSSTTWSGSDRDYTYDELLSRVFEIILDKNPDMAAGRKPKFVMRPPQVLRVGTKKTSFANFTDICKTLHRYAPDESFF